MYTILAVFVLVICVIALVSTFLLGMKQNKQHNQKYDKSRKRTIIWLSLIYLVSIILGVWALYYFV